jgi:lipid-A-disaccharide synthase
MQTAGCEAWHPLEALSVGGFTEVISRLPEILAIRRALARRLVAERVPMFIGVDAPDFNLGLERKLKRRGVRTIHFVSPSVWAWRRGRVATIGRAVDRILALFPFEPPIYEKAGVAVTFVGHPLAQEAATLASKRDAREQLKLGMIQPVFALLPGSRMAELDMHGDLVLRTAAVLHAARPEARFLVPLATRSTRDRFDTARYRLGLEKLPLTLLYGHATDALRAADVGVVASGTATLEAALAGCPHVIFYRVSAVTAGIIRRRILVPWVGLPNVLAGKFVVPSSCRRPQPSRTSRKPRSICTMTRSLGGASKRCSRDSGERSVPTRERWPRRPSPPSFVSRDSRAEIVILLIAGIDEAGTRTAGGPGRRGRGHPRSRADDRRSPRFQGALRTRARPARDRNPRAFARLGGRRSRGRRDRRAQHSASDLRRDAPRCDRSSHRPGASARRRQSLPVAAVSVRPVVGGDRSVAAISAASILAKTARDQKLNELDSRYPAYGFAHNKGYGTPEHLAALARHGPCPAHRRTFAPVRQPSFDF